jgi:hypothetical protein
MSDDQELEDFKTHIDQRAFAADRGHNPYNAVKDYIIALTRVPRE